MFKNFFDGYEAIIFDLDGTIVNDEFVWDQSLINVFSKEIISSNPYYGERGQNLSLKIQTILMNNTFRSSLAFDSYYRLVLNDFSNNIEQVSVTPGFEEFATFLKNKGKRLLLATNSDFEITSRIIQGLKLNDYFDQIITADDISLPKPAPEIYELAIEKLQLDKSKVVVFEDSINGVLAAEEAGLNVLILLPNEFKPSDYGSKQRVFIEDFETITDNLDSDADTYILEFFSK